MGKCIDKYLKIHPLCKETQSNVFKSDSSCYLKVVRLNQGKKEAFKVSVNW